MMLGQATHRSRRRSPTSPQTLSYIVAEGRTADPHRRSIDLRSRSDRVVRRSPVRAAFRLGLRDASSATGRLRILRRCPGVLAASSRGHPFQGIAPRNDPIAPAGLAAETVGLAPAGPAGDPHGVPSGFSAVLRTRSCLVRRALPHPAVARRPRSDASVPRSIEIRRCRRRPQGTETHRTVALLPGRAVATSTPVRDRRRGDPGGPAPSPLSRFGAASAEEAPERRPRR